MSHPLKAGDTPEVRCKFRNVARQTLSFELPELPGQEFRIALPELISDANRSILPWGFVSPEFEIRDHEAQLTIEVPNEVRMEACVADKGDCIEAQLRLTNLSGGTWVLVNAFICFACVNAPLFYDSEGSRTWYPKGGKWQALSELRSEHPQPENPYTLIRVKGGPELSEMWVCRKLQGLLPGSASQSCACITSADHKWVAGMSTHNGAYLFNNRQLSCIHADPLMGTVRPGASCEGASTVLIIKGTIDDFAERCAALEGAPGSVERKY